MINKDCFTGDTLVVAKSGLKLIKDLKCGDKVLTYNFEKEKTEYKDIINISKHNISVIYRLYFENEMILTTYKELFFIGKTEIRTEFLRPGNKLVTSSGDIVLENVNKINKEYEVYNLEVADNDNFYVGKNGILVKHC